MVKETLTAIIIFAVIAAVVIFFISSGKNTEITVLDGPGSCLEEINGTVTEVTETDENGYYAIIVEPDSDFSYLFNNRLVMVKLCESDSQHLNMDHFNTGDHIFVTFAAGDETEEENYVIIDNPYYYGLSDDNRSEN